MRSFQSDQGLGVDGDPGPQTRARLFRAYMDTLCRDENGEPFQMAAADFLGCGADSAGKGDFQGCGEFNPLLMFSREENDRLSRQENRAERNRENAPNRRVLVLLFRPGSRVNLDRWPCPRAKEGVEGCRRRFFSDAQERSRFQDLLREFQNTRDTFACRFYQRISAGSPCESLTSGLMTTNVYISVYFDVSPLPDNLKDRFQLLSHDSMCDLMLGRGDAVPFDEKRLVLRFSGVLPEKRYSLVHHLASGVKNTVFRDIAVVSIDSFGDATPQPRARSAQKPQPEPPPGFDCEDPIVVPDPADEAPREDTETAEESEMS